MIVKKLHHNAYRCRDSEETRRFYEDFLGLRLAGTLLINETKTGRATNTLHTFYELADGSFLAFFEAPDQSFHFKAQHDYDLHMALEVEERELAPMLEKARYLGIEARGIVDHEFIKSTYFRDPNGYVIELAAKSPDHALRMDPSKNGAREKLAAWTAAEHRRSA